MRSENMSKKGSKFQSRKNGPMDKFVKPSFKPETSPGGTRPLTQRQLSSAQASPFTTVKQEEEPHATHSFVWVGSDKKPTNLICDKAGTIEDSLKKSAQFRVLAGKNKNRELLIVKEGKAISSHFPCSLIKNEHLTVSYIKASDKDKQSAENRAPAIRQRQVPSDKLVVFHVVTKGKKNLAQIMKNPELRQKFEEITVYALKGHKVKDALKRDGRLLKKVFQTNCALIDRTTDVRTEMHSLVDDLDGKTLKIEMINKCTPPESPPESLEDTDVPQSESQKSDFDENQDPQQQSTTNESVTDNTTKEKSKQNGHIQPKKIPNSKKLKSHLSSQVRKQIKGMKTGVPKLSNIQNLFRVEYGKNAQTCREVKTMKKLMDLSDSVCHVRINGKPGGSGFLLFDKFVLTNGHVVKNIYNESTGQLSEPMTVHFSFESLDQVDSGIKVEEVTGFEYGCDSSGHMYDWALLRISTDQELPQCLLKNFGFLPSSGGICIIGHPDGAVKKIDPCLIIPTDNRNKVVEKHNHENPGGVLVDGVQYSENQGHINLVTQQFFENVSQSVQKPVLTYETCFYFGSSGSPVFDEHCNVVAMHSAGYAYTNRGGEKSSVIEYGYPLSLILEHIIIRMVERGRFDVLKEYLACKYAQHQNMMTNLKKLVESRNLVSFRNAFSSLVHTNDESLKMFFQLLQKEEPVAMDTD
ncbi:serine protease FAM111A-like [Tautogolabrus adspersus]